MELLAPAGDKQKLIMAIHYGADAVYLASTRFGLRTFAGNFDLEELKWAVEYAHEHNVKVYVTVNIIPHESDLKDLPEYILYLEKIGIDAVICADLGVISMVRRIAPNLHIHVSTQANITNSESAMVYVNMGVKRLILAREMTMEEICKALGKNIEPNFGPDRKGDIKHSNADISKARNLLGYDPDYDFAKGIALAIDWYKEDLSK